MTKTVGEIMTRKVQTIEANVTISDAYTTMKQMGFRHLPVVEPKTNKLLGLISDRDIKKFMSPFVGSARETAQDKATLLIEVGKVMVKSVMTATPDTEVKKVIDQMLMKKFNAVPVVDADGRLVGMLTTVDFMKLLMSML